ncbi:MAG: ABC transporter substrate-binding protein [Alphaproteobacteria bacterium]|nr:ABC transporter substrate-binding protein [Alphaproteobacteria bacterium]
MRKIAALAMALGTMAMPAFADDPKPVHGLAMHGEPKYKPDFTQLDYVERSAPKGGQITLAAIGTYDNLNSFVLKGIAAAGLGLIYDTLAAGTSDEAFSSYGTIAQSMEVPDDRSWIIFNLRPEARFHDGKPITPEDVIFTFETLKTKGHPLYRSYYADVAKVEKLGDRRVKLNFAGRTNRELPLIVGQAAILPRHYWEGRDFERTTLEPPLGNGAYKIAEVDAGRSITYQRVADYWGKDLPINRGRENIETIKYDYFRDPLVAFEAFKAGQIDFRQENVSRQWATSYDFPAVKDGLIKREEIAHELPAGMQGFGFNTRRAQFKDPRVRQALGLAFDFEWSNKTLFYGFYKRSLSYFSNSELGSRGLPEGEELTILERYRGKVPVEVFTREYKLPTSDGTGNLSREHLREAFRLLKEAGWEIKGKALTNAQGQPFEFEILLGDPNWERITLPFVKNLERLGITAKVRTVDTAQNQKREDVFDFDMTVVVFGQSQSPGNEQRDFWHSTNVDVHGSRNLMGIKDPVIDELIDLVIEAPDRASLIQRTRALDRVLLWGHYVVPHWHLGKWWLAYWDKFDRPATLPKFSPGFPDIWWIDGARAAALAAKRG